MRLVTPYTPCLQPLPSKVSFGNGVETGLLDSSSPRLPRTFLYELDLYWHTSILELVLHVFNLKDTGCFSGNLGFLRHIFINKLT